MAYYQQGYQQPGGYQQGYQPQQMYQQYQQPSQQYGNYGGYFQQNVFSVNAWQVSSPRTNLYRCNVYTMAGKLSTYKLVQVYCIHHVRIQVF